MDLPQGPHACEVVGGHGQHKKLIDFVQAAHHHLAVLGLLHQQAFRAYAVENLQQHGSGQLLRRNAGSTTLDIGGIHAREQWLNPLQSLVDHLANRSPGMVLRHKVVKATNTEQALGEGIGSAHGALCGGWGDGFLLSGSVRPQGDFKGRYFSGLLVLEEHKADIQLPLKSCLQTARCPPVVSAQRFECNLPDIRIPGQSQATVGC
jgi:hypothetical protein